MRQWRHNRMLIASLLWVFELAGCASEMMFTSVEGMDDASPDSDVDGDADGDGDTEWDPVDTDSSDNGWDFIDLFSDFDDGWWSVADWTLGETVFSAENVAVQDGHLVLAHVGTQGGFTGGEVYSHSRFHNGTWKARLAGPVVTGEGVGTVCAFFMYGENGDGMNEIDFELLDGRVRVGTYAGWEPSHGHELSSTHQYMWWPEEGTEEADTFDTAQFHDYQIQRSWDEVSFLVDGEEIYSVTGTAVPQGSLGIHFNHWTTAGWEEVGYPPADDFLSCRVDEVMGAF